MANLLKDHQFAEGPYKITPYWQTYNNRIVREITRNGIGSLLSNYKLLKGFAEGGKPRVIPPENALKRFIFETFPKLPVFNRIVAEHQHLLEKYYENYRKLKIENAKTRLQYLEKQFGEIPLSFDLDAGNADDVFEWNDFKVIAKIVPYLERTCYFYSTTGEDKPESLLEIGPGLGLSTLCHVILNDKLKRVTNIDIPATLYLATQFLSTFDVLDVQNYTDFKQNGERETSSTKVTCCCLPPWAIEDISQKHDWLHNAYSFQEMEPDVVRNYLSISSKLIQKGYWLMSTIGENTVKTGGQIDLVTLKLIENLISKEFEKINLPVSNLVEMSDKTEETLDLPPCGDPTFKLDFDTMSRPAVAAGA
ncbi:putative sugar O-methyltransferase [Kiloniella sp. b19]|uniref:putative sugar O-methyltransferase n=1 Tax=Kiloniella sp. GXU_MW_B19 TaxID=3141326 RepID=UPI0031D37489